MTPAGALVARYAAVVCDLDGVVYRGPSAVPHAVEVLGALSVPVLYATNNASRSPADVAAHLRDLGLSCAPEAVATSSQAGAWLLADRLAAGSPVLAVGRCRCRDCPGGGRASARCCPATPRTSPSTPCCRATAPT